MFAGIKVCCDSFGFSSLQSRKDHIGENRFEQAKQNRHHHYCNADTMRDIDNRITVVNNAGSC